MDSKKWWKEAVVYQIYPKSFMDSNGDGIGDLNGIRQKLGYLKDLGIDAVWISPFYKSPYVDNGYDISDYQDINPDFGTMADFDALLSEAHAMGIKIVIDLVVNHSSNQHKWFIESRKSKDNPYRDFYIWRDGKNGDEKTPPNNWGSCFSGSAWKFDEETKQYYLHLFAPEQPDLNWKNPQVRKEVYNMMNWWCKKGVDGFRMDVIGMIDKDQDFPDGEIHTGALYGDFGPYSVNRDGMHEHLKEMNKEVLSKYDLLTVGEASSAKVEDALKFAGYDRNEIGMVFQFERIDAEVEGMKWNERSFDLVRLKKIMNKWQTELEGKAWNTLFWENHDQPRIVSRYHGDEGTEEERILFSKMLATVLYFQKGTPYIFQGQEIGMTNTVFNSLSDFRDLESINAYNELTGAGLYTPEKMMKCLNRVSRDNARTPMQWNNSANAGFTTGTPWIAVNANYKSINVENELSNENSIFNYYKKINHLRKQNQIMVYGDFKMLEIENSELFVYTRSLENQKLLVICNFSKKETGYLIPDEFKNAKVMLSNYSAVNDLSGNVKIRPYEAVVLYVEK